MAGRPLTSAELEAYDMVSADVAARVRVFRVPFIPGGYAGMTLGRHILLARDVAADGDSALLAHELVHVRQWTELGVVGFSGRYVGSFAKNLAKHRRWNKAYHAVDAELEAKRETTDWLRRRTRDNI